MVRRPRYNEEFIGEDGAAYLDIGLAGDSYELVLVVIVHLAAFVAVEPEVAVEVVA